MPAQAAAPSAMLVEGFEDLGRSGQVSPAAAACSSKPVLRALWDQSALVRRCEVSFSLRSSVAALLAKLSRALNCGQLPGTRHIKAMRRCSEIANILIKSSASSSSAEYLANSCEFCMLQDCQYKRFCVHARVRARARIQRCLRSCSATPSANSSAGRVPRTRVCISESPLPRMLAGELRLRRHPNENCYTSTKARSIYKKYDGKIPFCAAGACGGGGARQFSRDPA